MICLISVILIVIRPEVRAGLYLRRAIHCGMIVTPIHNKLRYIHIEESIKLTSTYFLLTENQI